MCGLSLLAIFTLWVFTLWHITLVLYSKRKSSITAPAVKKVISKQARLNATKSVLVIIIGQGKSLLRHQITGESTDVAKRATAFLMSSLLTWISLKRAKIFKKRKHHPSSFKILSILTLVGFTTKYLINVREYLVMWHDKPLCAKLNIYGFPMITARLSEVKHFWVKPRNKSHRIFYVLYINISFRTKQLTCGS